MHQTIAVHIEHPSRVATLALGEIRFEFTQFLFMRADAAVEGVDLHLQPRHHFLLVGDLSIDHLQGRQLRFHILAGRRQLILRFRHLLFETCLLILKFADAFVGRRWRRFALFPRLLSLCGGLGVILRFHCRGSSFATRSLRHHL